MIQKRSCWNCKHSINYRTKEIPQTYWEPGEPAMVEDCDAPAYDEDNWDTWETEFNLGKDMPDTLEEYVASKCGQYSPEQHKCSVCNKEVSADQSYCIFGIYDEEYHTCSTKCESIQKSKIALEYDEEYRAHFS